jgi:hypothetical protein
LFDQPVSLPLRAAIASLLGSLFGIALILATHPSQAQTHEGAATASASASAPTVAAISRITDAALRSLRSVAEPIFVSGMPRAQGLRIADLTTAPDSGLRWQVAPVSGLRSENDNPRGRDTFGLGMQVRF